MTKFIARIATGIAIIGLAAPAFAATTSNSMTTTAPAARTSVLHRTHRHRNVASAEKESKKSPKKSVKKGAVKSTPKSEKPAAPSTTPAAAAK